MTCRALCVSTFSVMLSGVAFGQTIIDFGTDPGQWDVADGFDYPFGPLDTSRSYQADTLTLNGVADALFEVSGSGFGGGAPFGQPIMVPADSQLYLDGYFSVLPTFDLFDFRAVLLTTEGTIEYRFVTQTFDVGTGTFLPGVTLPTTPGSRLVAVQNPVPSTGPIGVGALLDQVQFVLQNGNIANGTFTLVIDEIGFQPIPEPATLALLGMGAMLTLRRRR